MTFTQFLSILRARWKLSALVFALTVLTAVVVSLVLPKKYTATASVVVDAKPDPITGMMLAGVANMAMMATQVDIITSDRVARRVIRNLKLDQNPQVREQWQEATDGEGNIEDWLGGVFQKQLDVKPSRESNVINIGYQAPDPQFAAGVANAFVQAYIDTAIELRVDPARRYSGFFDDRSKEAREAVEAAQARLSEYQQTSGIIGNDERLDVETQRLNELNSQLVMLQSLAAESNSRSAQSVGSGDRMSEALNNPVVSSIKLELSRAEANLQELNTRLGANHPQVVQARANITELRSRLEVETKRAVGSTTVNANVNAARVADVRAQLEAQRAKVLKLKGGRDEMSVLQRDVDNAQKTYDALVGRMNQSNLESQTQQSNVNVLSAASPPLLPSSPKVLLNTIVAIFLGGLLALGTALVREMMDRRVRGPQDLVEALGLPMLGVMPKPAVKSGPPSLMAQRVISGRLPAPDKKQG
ncbi:chain length determinant protein EpsF [Ideonella margarita]|uniref:Chain length determinant protein EpsF n=1 Tax=Ideonella margarita TaxID=2984191 RepID=A0ABU9C320_9BURK